mmetsp:Transcript_54430/g.102082  ORF Transcript_54430/g.102082 Transcript_54430/m.102082 type:complete len:356 (-) Transcript_54430:340-1407(-)
MRRRHNGRNIVLTHRHVCNVARSLNNHGMRRRNLPLPSALHPSQRSHEVSALHQGVHRRDGRSQRVSVHLRALEQGLCHVEPITSLGKLGNNAWLRQLLQQDLLILFQAIGKCRFHHVAGAAMGCVSQEVTAKDFRNQHLVPAVPMLQYGLDHVMTEVVTAEVQSLGTIFQNLVDQTFSTLLARAMLQQSAHDPAAKAMSSKSSTVAEELVGDEGRSGWAHLSDDLLYHIVRVRRNDGVTNMTMKLRRKVLGCTIASLLHGELHHAAAVSVTGQRPYLAGDFSHGHGKLVATCLQKLAKVFAFVLAQRNFFHIAARLNHSRNLGLRSAGAAAAALRLVLAVHGIGAVISARHVRV